MATRFGFLFLEPDVILDALSSRCRRLRRLPCEVVVFRRFANTPVERVWICVLGSLGSAVRVNS